MKKQSKNLAKRFLSLLLAVVMIITCAPVQISAAQVAANETIEISVGEIKTLRSFWFLSRMTWESSDTNVVTVSSKGVITGVSVGTATVTGTIKSMFSWFGGGATVNTYEIIVTEGQGDIPTIHVGETITLNVEERGTTTWKSSDVDVATVTNEGVVTGVEEGAATITATTKSGGFCFWFFSWGGKTTTTKFKIKVVANESEEPTPEPEPENNVYTVTFETNGGSSVESQTVEEGQIAVKPENPTKEGYLFAGWCSDEELTASYEFTTVVCSDITLYAKWDIDNENYCNVEYVLVLEDDKVDNAENFKNIRVAKGEKLTRPEEPVSKYAQFVDWYTGLDTETEFDFEAPVTEDISIFAKWNLDTTDTDCDGIYDSVESDFGTDLEKADTDGDGLNDYIEKVISTDPLLSDTDGDSISDYDGDADGDTLSNGYEAEIGTKPEHEDSDHDGLRDNEEINGYKTDPLKEDTDNDGASDFWEINNGFDPLVANSSFEIKASSEEVNEYNLTSASVDIEVDGEQVNTLSIEKVNYAENPLVRNTLPGYMGSAYDFKVNGLFEEATISFDYNVEIYGEPDEEFQPRIYYLNEERGCYEELENQTVANGKVSARVTHFSTYILLNKVEFDKVWDTEIKPPNENIDEENAVLDIVFVIDYSLSMEDNDPNQLCKQLSKEFVSKLRDGMDRAAVVQFIKVASLLSPLTTDKSALNRAIDSIVYDDGYGTNSGTDGSAGIHLALEQLTPSASLYKYIVFVTDGADNGYSYSYDDLISSAVESNINIYTVGMGSASEEVLRKVALETGGKYYHATTSAEAGDILNLDDVFEEIESETIDYTTDSNDDGLSDYYTQLIYEGKMPMADHLSGIDFSGSADHDGDGLKNGEEIKIVHNNEQIFLVMDSDPTLKHTDRDGIDDYTEVQNGTSPLKYTLKKTSVDYLINDDNFYSPGVSDDYQDGGFGRFIVDVNAGINIVWNRHEIYRDIMIDYFVNYSKEDYLDDISFEVTRSTIVNTLSNILGAIKERGADYYDYYDKVVNMIDFINGTTNKDDLYLIYQKVEVLIEEISTIFPDDTVIVQSRALTTVKITSVNITQLGKTVGKVCNGLTIAVGILDVVDTWKSFSAVSANNMAFEQNLDILQEIIDNSPDKDAVSAAKDVKNKLEGEYTEQLKAALTDVVENAFPMIAETLMMKNPYTAAIVVVRNGLALITGITVDLKQHFSMFTYTEMIRATNRLLKENVLENTNAYEALSYGDKYAEMLDRFLTHIAQLRILDEQMFCDWQEEDGVIGWFTDNSDVEEVIDQVVENIIYMANELNLNLNANLY